MYSSASVLDSIEFLARSPHRIEALDAIRAEPRTRDELRELTDASRVTLGRILADFEERDWIVRVGPMYETTSRGAFIAAEFTRLVSNLETSEELPELLELLPGEQPTFDLRLLNDATVIIADESDLLGPIRRGLDHIKRTERLRIVANGASLEFLEEMREAVQAGSTQTVLLPPKTIDALRTNSKLRGPMGEMLKSGRVTLLRYDGDEDLPVVQIGDGTIALCSGDHRAMIESDDAAVYEWADSYFESLQADATSIGVEAFTDEMEMVEGDPFTD